MKLKAAFTIFVLLFALAWHFKAHIAQYVYHTFPHLTYHYFSSNTALHEQLAQTPPTPIGWGDLIPDDEKAILEKFQQPTVANLTEQILLSIEASTNEAYRDAMFSTNIIESLIGSAVNISGFIVPLEVGADQTLQSFFFVPYFGACTHYPPPPPNQMLYVRLDDTMLIPDLNQAYTLTGVLSDGLYEDVLGTSAYQLATAKMRVFAQNPDDFRTHTIQ
jgi:hypothetical protein